MYCHRLLVAHIIYLIHIFMVQLEVVLVYVTIATKWFGRVKHWLVVGTI